LNSKFEKPLFSGQLTLKKMVNQITTQKIHKKTARIPSIPLVRRFTFCTVNHCLTTGYLTPQLVRVFSVLSDHTLPPEKKQNPN
jgi:hypothetical protein